MTAPELAYSFGCAETERRQAVVTDGQAAMWGACFCIARFPSMVIDQFHVAGIRPVKAEAGALITGDLNRPAAGTVAARPMKSKARRVQICWCGGDVEASQDAIDFPGEMWRYSLPVSVLVEAL